MLLDAVEISQNLQRVPVLFRNTEEQTNPEQTNPACPKPILHTEYPRDALENCVIAKKVYF